MKILFLNAWSAELRGPLTAYLRQHVPDMDVFCFQEAEGPMVDVCAEVLGGYRRVARHKFVTEPDDFFVETYVREGIQMLSSGGLLEHEDGTGLWVYVQLELAGKRAYICNLHGMSRPVDKSDNPERRRQTQGAMEFLADKEGAKIIGGDFYVFPDSPSLQIIRHAGYRDLIADYGITNTRNHFAWDRYPENPRQYHSDYVFVSNDVQVQAFTAPDPEISDHTPLLLTITL